MSTLQKELIRLAKTGRNTIKELSNHTGETQHTVTAECRHLVDLGLMTTNFVKTQYFA